MLGNISILTSSIALVHAGKVETLISSIKIVNTNSNNTFIDNFYYYIPELNNSIHKGTKFEAYTL